VRLLVTNDDGIGCVFLHELVRALIAADHEVFVVAPKVEQSWTGASKSRHRPVRSDRADLGLGCPAWSVDGTPSDCVNIGIDHLLGRAPEAVLSGINVGLNASLGFILGSGTVAGACEGALHGLPGIALSQSLDVPVYERVKDRGGAPDEALLSVLRASARLAARIAPRLAAETAPRSFIVHNLNFPYPCSESAQVRRTIPARVMLPGLFSPQPENGAHQLVFKLGEDTSPEAPLTDRAALDAGFISHSVLDFSKLGSI
jgi:5'-nucleotidase